VDSVVERAERLRVLLAVVGEESALPPGNWLSHGLPELSRRDCQLLQDVTPDDLALANAALAAGADLREGEYQRAEALLAMLPGGAATLPDQLRELGRPEFLDACQLMARLAWIHPPDQGDE
jgi:hypothetical protein